MNKRDIHLGIWAYPSCKRSLCTYRSCLILSLAWNSHQNIHPSSQTFAFVEGFISYLPFITKSGSGSALPGYIILHAIFTVVELCTVIFVRQQVVDFCRGAVGVVYVAGLDERERRQKENSLWKRKRDYKFPERKFCNWYLCNVLKQKEMEPSRRKTELCPY